MSMNMFEVGERIAVALERAADALERQAAVAEGVRDEMATAELVGQIDAIPAEAMMAQAAEFMRQMLGNGGLPDET